MLQKSHVAANQRGRREPHHLPEWEIPWHHREHDPERLELDPPVCAGDGLGFEKCRSMFRVVPAGQSALLRFLHRRRERLAHLERHQTAVLLFVLFQPSGHAHQERGPVRDRRLAPEPRRMDRSLQPSLDFIGRVRVDSTKHLAGGRVDAREDGFHVCNSHERDPFLLRYS